MVALSSVMQHNYFKKKNFKWNLFRAQPYWFARSQRRAEKRLARDELRCSVQTFGFSRLLRLYFLLIRLLLSLLFSLCLLHSGREVYPVQLIPIAVPLTVPDVSTMVVRRLQ